MMPVSGLRDKLKAMSNSGSPKKPAREPLGLKFLSFDEGQIDGLLDLSETAIRRLGYESTWPEMEKVLFLDTETTGLSGGTGTIAFLVGLGYIQDGRFIVEQYMARDYADEAELLHAVANVMARFETVVTFNGKSFDMPLLASRFTMCRMREEWTELRHLDLLHPARRLWKRRLGSCKLSVIEDEILRRGREDDLPGSEVPERFFAFLKTGDEGLLEDVLHHNRLDIVSLGYLLANLSSAYANPTAQTEISDLFSMGRTIEKQGEQEEAIRCYQLAGMPRSIHTVKALRGEVYQAEANMALALLMKRRREYHRAEQVLKMMAERKQLEEKPLIELAKLCEHRFRDIDSAIRWTTRALEMAHDPETIAMLKLREARLTAKKAKRMVDKR